MPNWSQVSGGIDRVVLMGLTWLASKGYITSADIANYAALIIGLVGVVYSFYVNRNTNLAKQAASIPGTTVVTTPSIAGATNEQNIVSNTTAKVI